MQESDLPGLARRLGGTGEPTGSPPVFVCNCPTMRHTFRAPNGCLELSWVDGRLHFRCQKRCTEVEIDKAVRKEFLTPPRKLTKKQIAEEAEADAARAARWAAHDWDQTFRDEGLGISITKEVRYNLDKTSYFWFRGRVWNIETGAGFDCDIDLAPGLPREALINSIFKNLPIWRRRVGLKERYTPPKPRPAAAKPTRPKWIKAKKTDNIYCKLPAGTFTCFAVGTEWGISWFPVGGTMPMYDKADNALRLYDTRDAARLAAEGFMANVPTTGPPPPRPWKNQPPPTPEELDMIWEGAGLPRGPVFDKPRRIPDEVLNKMVICGNPQHGDKWESYLPLEYRKVSKIRFLRPAREAHFSSELTTKNGYKKTHDLDNSWSTLKQEIL
jgi:hypothetical protein